MFMHKQYGEFIDATQNKKKLRIKFHFEEDGCYIERICAPMGHAAGNRIRDEPPQCWVWGFDSNKISHILPLIAEKLSLCPM